MQPLLRVAGLSFGVLHAPVRLLASRVSVVSGWRKYPRGDRFYSQQMIVQLLQNIGSQKEVEQYLKLYSSVDSQKFAVIKVGGGVLENELDELVSSLSFLSNVGLTPIVVHGAGPQLNRKLESLGITSSYVNGLRVTTPSILEAARSVFEQQNLTLVRALERAGVRARPILSGVFQAEVKDDSLGLVGEVKHVNTSSVLASVSSGYVPILTCLGSSRSGQLLNINADIAARELARVIEPLKVVYISHKGGLCDKDGNKITNIDIRDDFDLLMNQPWFKHGDRLKLKEIRTLIEALPRSSSVAITSAKLLAHELFTHKGSGTLIRSRERIGTYSSLDEIEIDRLATLLETAFEGRLSPSYFDDVRPHIERIYISELYRACAIVTKLSESVSYLDKFAVVQQFQSDGLGNRIFELMVADNPKLMWRSRQANPINSWYLAKSQGSISANPWRVFWYGLDSLSSVEPLAKQVAEKAPNIVKWDDVRELTPASKFLRADASRCVKVGLIGVRGYTGAEIVNLICSHPHIDLAVVSSRSLKGRRLADVHAAYTGDLEIVDLLPEHLAMHNDVDLWILAMPNGAAKPFVECIAPSQKVVDLSADYRFVEDASWAYGLPERRGAREIIRRASRVANPGCYATIAQLSLFPLLYGRLGNIVRGTPTLFGVSGYSGAGTAPSRKNDVALLIDNIMPYSQCDHIHEREIAFQCSDLLASQKVHFMPNVASWFRGISMTTNVTLSRSCSAAELVECYRSYYSGERLVDIREDIPEVKDSAHRHNATIGGFSVDPSGHRVVVNATIDNLLKGAATQCIQNVNLLCGFDDYVGIGDAIERSIGDPLTSSPSVIAAAE